jgi:hypothetical protein
MATVVEGQRTGKGEVFYDESVGERVPVWGKIYM